MPPSRKSLPERTHRFRRKNNPFHPGSEAGFQFDKPLQKHHCQRSIYVILYGNLPGDFRFCNMFPEKIKPHKMKVSEHPVQHCRMKTKAFPDISCKQIIESPCTTTARTGKSAYFPDIAFKYAFQPFQTVFSNPNTCRKHRQPNELAYLIKNRICPFFHISAVKLIINSHPNARISPMPPVIMPAIAIPLPSYF